MLTSRNRHSIYIVCKLRYLFSPSGHKALLFSQMTTMLDIVQDYLTYRGILLVTSLPELFMKATLFFNKFQKNV